MSRNFFSTSAAEAPHTRRAQPLKINQALILAAGRGVRLGPRGRAIPKGFIEVGGATLIQRSLGLLASAGISRVSIVTGHLAERYEQLPPVTGLSITPLHNPHFATMGSYESLRTGLAAMEGSFLLLESDIIYEPRALEALLAAPQESVILASGPTGAGDEVYVWADEVQGATRFRGMSKQRSAYPDAPHGELTGISKISATLACRLLQHAAAADPASDYESAIVQAAATTPVACLRIDDLLWGEIDDEVMLSRVQTHLWPRLQQPG